MFARLVIVGSLMLTVPLSVFAHGGRGTVSTPIDEGELRQEAEIAVVVALIGPPGETDPNKVGQKSLFGMALRWPNGKTLIVCMQQQSKPLRALIASVAMEWMQSGANIKFDFGDPLDPRRCDSPTATADIRIADDPNSPLSPYWSWVGTQALDHPGEWTMDLGFANGADPDAKEALSEAAAGNKKFRNYFHFAVLHEFGHALGALHEHQWGTCAQYLDADRAVAELFPSANTLELKQEAAANLEALTKTEINAWGAVRLSTKEDPKSVMRYNFPSDIYTKKVSGKKAPDWCSNQAIEYASTVDLAGIMTAYPPPNGPQPPALAAVRRAAAAATADQTNNLSAAARARMSAVARINAIPSSTATAPAAPMAAPHPPPSPLPVSGIALLNKLVGAH